MYQNVGLIRRRVASAILAFWLGPASVMVAAGGEVSLTQAGPASALVQSDVSQIAEFRLEGVIYGVDAARQALALRDDSGFIWLEGLAFSQPLEPGMRIVVAGTGTFGNGQAQLQPTPVVEQDWARGSIERAGIIHLKSGRHPFELVYLQTTGSKSLEVFYEGPNFARTNVPASALFCAAAGQFVPGLKFECYQGTWTQAPDFAKLKPVSSGITTNFSVEISGRETNFALRFSGFIEIPVAANYRFTVAADDRARLTLPYDATHRIAVLGREDLLPPTPIAPGQTWGDQSEPLWAVVEGTVQHVGSYAGQLQMELYSEQAGQMRVTVADGRGAVPSLLLNSRIQAHGLARSTINPVGRRMAGDLFVPSMNEITIPQVAEVLWLLHPVEAISNLMALVGVSNVSERIVQLRGTPREAAGGRQFVLEDATGRIRIQATQALPSDAGAELEIIGRLVIHDGVPTVDSAVYRLVPALAPGTALPLLTTIEQVRRLKPAQAAQHLPVKVRGVVTFVFSGGKRAHIQGESEGIYVSGLSTSQQTLRVGDLCEFDGFTSAGAFSPVLTYRSAPVLGRGSFPVPRHPTWEQLMNGSLDSNWVEVQGVVQRVSGHDLLIGMRGGEITARFFHEDASDLQSYLDAIVRVRGTVRPIANRQRQIQSVQIQVASPLQLTVDQPAPDDRNSTPFKLVSELREFDAAAASFQRVRTAGQIIHVGNGVGYLMDGTNGLRFLARDLSGLAPGDRVEVVGFPEIMAAAPVLQQASVRNLGPAPLPAPRPVGSDDLLAGFNDSTRVRVNAKVLGFRTNNTDQVLELQIGSRLCQARLNHQAGELPPVAIDSSVLVVGTYAAQGYDGINVQSFELLLNSPADVTIVRHPAWWTLGRIMVVVGGMTLGLAGAFAWITLLRRKVEARTRELQEEIEERKRMGLEVERVHRQLVDASRQAGQAEVASSVLHNVGNVLNSVNVSTCLISDRLRKMRLANISKVADLMQDHAGDLGRFLTVDEKGRQLPAYLEDLGRHLAAEQADLIKEANGLAQNIEHIKGIVVMQQTYAQVSGVTETIAPAELVESAFKMHVDAFMRHGVHIVREFDEVPPVTVDKHRVLQILVNLLHNAKQACAEGDCAERRVQVRINRTGKQGVKIEVADNGVGIPPENLTRIFGHGFTTRKNGHGFGLHSSALAARELGGTLTVQSEGSGQGASFTLELPVTDCAPATEILAAR